MSVAVARAHGKGRFGVRAIAIFEALKGVIVLVAGSGMLLFFRRDAQSAAEAIVAHLHLDPASHYPRIFLGFAKAANPSSLRFLALGAAVYALLRFIEAFGLWRNRRWAEWFGVVTAAAYLPFELIALAAHPGPEPLIAIAINLLVIAVLARQLFRHRARQAPPIG